MAVQLNNDQRSTIRATLLANSCGCGGLDVPWKGMGAQEIDKLSDAELAVYNQWITTLAQAADRSVGQAIVRTAAVGNGGPGPAVPPPPPPPAPNRPKSMTEALEQFGTEEERAVWNSAIEVHNREKGELIAQLMGHITGEQQRQAVYNFYKDKSTAELRLLRETMPVTSTNQGAQAPRLSYFGAAGGPPPAAVTDEEPLTSPVYNWEPSRKRA